MIDDANNLSLSHLFGIMPLIQLSTRKWFFKKVLSSSISVNVIPRDFLDVSVHISTATWVELKGPYHGWGSARKLFRI